MNVLESAPAVDEVVSQAAGKLGDAGLALLVLALLFVPLERVLRPDASVQTRQHFTLDLTYFFWMHVLWGGAVSAVLTSLAVFMHPLLEPHRGFVTSMPLWAQGLTAWILGDVLLYWGHRIQHRVPWLWKFHRVHHSAPELDWLAAYREHPIDGLYTRTLANLPAMLMGFSWGTIAGLITLMGL